MIAPKSTKRKIVSRLVISTCYLPYYKSYTLFREIHIHCLYNLYILVPAASMWTKKELGEFKDSIRNEGGDSIIKVNILRGAIGMN